MYSAANSLFVGSFAMTFAQVKQKMPVNLIILPHGVKKKLVRFPHRRNDGFEAK